MRGYYSGNGVAPGQGGAIRNFWWCGYCKEDFMEPRGSRSLYPVVDGLQAKYRRCRCGTKLYIISS